MVRKEDLYWSESDTDAIKEYKKQFEAGKIPHTILNNGSKDTTQTKEEMMCLIFETAHKMKKGEIPVATQYDSIQDFIDDKRKT